MEEKVSITKKLKEAESEISDLKGKIEGLQNEINAKEKKIIELEEKINLFGDIKTQRDQIQSDYDTLSADQKKTLAEVEALKEEFTHLRDQDHKEHQRLIEQHEHDNRIADELRSTLAERENKIHGKIKILIDRTYNQKY